MVVCMCHQSEKDHGLRCGTFGASSLEDRHMATGDYAGNLRIW
jgi:WD repeat-containing protein 92